MCDPRDLGVTLTEDSTEPSRDYRPNLYLYDSYPGGIGGSEPLFRMQERLLRSTAELIAGCPCEHGCPSCVGPVGEVGERGKEVASRVLAEILSGAGEQQMVAGVDAGQ
jgi:DEAD/DEAH box helicase domain-containing protein